MHEYIYTGEHPRVLIGLSQSVNAFHRTADGDPSQLADGVTIEVARGEGVATEEPYEVDGLEPVAAPQAASKRRRHQPPAPDHDSPAEPAPADAEPTPNGDAN